MDPDTAKLISLVKARPDLYNRNVRNKHADVLDRSWKEIATEMNRAERDCKLQWNRLRHYYTRVMRENRKPLKNKQPRILKRKMAFLQKYIALKKNGGKRICRDPEFYEETDTEASEQSCSSPVNPSLVNEVSTNDETVEIRCDANQLFIRSLLWDLNNLNRSKQRTFKRKAFQILDDLFDNEDEVDAAAALINLHAQNYEEPKAFTKVFVKK